MENNIEELKRMGMKAVEMSDFQSAIRYFTLALDQNPKDTDILNNRAICLRAKKQYDEALNDVSSAIIISPNNALYYSTRASILTLMSKQLEALNDINTAIDLHPTLEYVMNKVVILRKLNHYQEALFLIKNIESQGYGSDEVSVYKGVILIDMRKLKEAETVFESLLNTEQHQLAEQYLKILKNSKPLPNI